MNSEQHKKLSAILVAKRRKDPAGLLRAQREGRLDAYLAADLQKAGLVSSPKKVEPKVAKATDAIPGIKLDAGKVSKFQSTGGASTAAPGRLDPSKFGSFGGPNTSNTYTPPRKPLDASKLSCFGTNYTDTTPVFSAETLPPSTSTQPPSPAASAPPVPQPPSPVDKVLPRGSPAAPEAVAVDKTGAKEGGHQHQRIGSVSNLASRFGGSIKKSQAPKPAPTPPNVRSRVEEARLALEAKAAEEARLAQEAKAVELALEAKAAEEARLALEAKAAEEARLAQEAKEAEEARLAQEAKAAEFAQEAKAAEETRLAQEAKEAEDARLAQEAKAAAETEAPAAVQAQAVAADSEEGQRGHRREGSVKELAAKFGSARNVLEFCRASPGSPGSPGTLKSEKLSPVCPHGAEEPKSAAARVVSIKDLAAKFGGANKRVSGRFPTSPLKPVQPASSIEVIPRASGEKKLSSPPAKPKGSRVAELAARFNR
ncbi:unnamed protein product [Chrysoparadoxa australica]